VSDPTHPVRLYQNEPGRYVGRARGRDLEALLLDGVWVVYVDGIERFSAFRLAIVERKLEDWLA
jgi:hypothetical protein